MSNPVEVAIQKALQDRLLAMTESPAISVSLPNVAFPQPPAVSGAKWLRATLAPAPTLDIAIGYSSENQHYGLLLVDVFGFEGDGEYAPGRDAADVISWFKRGTKMTQDGFVVEITKPPRRERLVRDPPWVMIPVTIPYLAFAPNPA